MEKKILKLVIGSLLHDIGKVLHRGNDGRNHSVSGYDFLKNEVKLSDEEILDQVRFHHAKEIREHRLNDENLAYITYMADNIASGIDRRELDDKEWGFSKEMPLSSIYNILNHNDEKKNYNPGKLSAEGDINYPGETNGLYNESHYEALRAELLQKLSEIELSESYVNSLLELLEAYLTYVPSSTSHKERADISLYDHMKLTAALASAIYLFLTSKENENYRKTLFDDGKRFYEEKSFLLYSLDFSGIQDFIYTTASRGALKSLRGRSFYLEIMMEHLVDELLDKAEITRVNVLYTGGGHSYLLLPNTGKMKMIIDEFESESRSWFMETFGAELYVSGGYAECSTMDLRNQPAGSYKKIFQEAGRNLSIRKLRRYDADEIRKLNNHKALQSERECVVCRRRDLLGEGEKCRICAGIESFSGSILHEPFFVIANNPLNGKIHDGLPLPGNKIIRAASKEELIDQMKHDQNYVRSYAKNSQYIGHGLATKLWVGDYMGAKTFEEMGDSAQGINRIAVMRGDIDNLGKAFVAGFENEKYGDRYVTLSRTATFSRSLSLFMKHHINQILSEGTYYLDSGKSPGRRKVSVVYSGGDDTFVVGSWDEVIGFSVDLYHLLKKYTQGTLTYSAGIGIFASKYPVIAMARETAALESTAKSLDGKNAVSLFSEAYTWSWEIFIEKVLMEKLKAIQLYFDVSRQHGMSFLYHLLALIRQREEKINLARYAYLLARMEPPKDAEETVKNGYRDFSRKMYDWMKNKEDCRQLEMAMQIYAYLNRNQEEDSNE